MVVSKWPQFPQEQYTGICRNPYPQQQRIAQLRNTKGPPFQTNTHCKEDGEHRKWGPYDVLSSRWSMLREKDGAAIGYQQKTLQGGK
jgi:hypothetical protein